MEGPISKFMHVQQPDSYWHQTTTNTSAFKSPDLIELNSDTERNVKNATEPLNYSSSQEEAETEDDGCDAPDATVSKVALTSVNDEESCHLLQTEDDSDSEHAWNSSDSAAGSSRSSSSNGGTISDGEGIEGRRSSRLKQAHMDNYWDMSPEQEKYYTDQFLTLHSDVNGLVSGALAKGFFEKSKLPLSELREIWQLADVTRDGCLDLSEFKMAMHLVVLRRHGLPIPSHFYIKQQEVALGQSSSSSIFKIGGPLMRSVTPKTSRTSGSSSQQSPLVSAASIDSKSQVSQSQSKRPSKEWTTFENEPINFSSTCDTSRLVAPVPVRLKTPEDKMILNSTPQSSASSSKTHQLQLKAIQRPKLSGHHPKVSSGTIAPPPPPRRKTHVRSSSLDLNRLTISSEMSHVPTMNGIRGSELPSRSFLSPCHQGGAFSVYKKPQIVKAATIHEPSNIPGHDNSTTLVNVSSKVQLEQEVVDLKNENELLSRISAQLLDQLSGLQSRRHSVAYKVHQLHSNLS